MKEKYEKIFSVWIYDEISGCNQPIKVKANDVSEAFQTGLKYIQKWNLINAKITKIDTVQETYKYISGKETV